MLSTKYKNIGYIFSINVCHKMSSEERRCFYISGVRPLGICLYTNHDYFMEQCAMTWGVNYIGDDLIVFQEEFKNHWSGDKGLSYNISCWEVLHELAYSKERYAFIDYHHKPSKNIYDCVPDDIFEMLNPLLYKVHKSTDDDIIHNLINYQIHELEKEFKNGAGEDRLLQVWDKLADDGSLEDYRDELVQKLQDLSRTYFGKEIKIQNKLKSEPKQV